MKPSLLPAFLIPSLFIRVHSREFVVFKNEVRLPYGNNPRWALASATVRIASA